MKARGSNFYPPEGHDWVGTNEIRRVHEDVQTLAEEKYTRDVKKFKGQFFGKLLAHQALNSSFGWALFTDQDPGSTSDHGSREVLLFSKAMTHPTKINTTVPLVRILTNEAVDSESGRAYLTEEVTVDDRGSAQYLSSAINMTNDDPGAFNASLKLSLAPLFFIRDSQLMITSNLRSVTPLGRVADDRYPGHYVLPFGSSAVLSDKIYALDKATELLTSVIHCSPVAQQL